MLFGVREQQELRKSYTLWRKSLLEHEGIELPAISNSLT